MMNGSYPETHSDPKPRDEDVLRSLLVKGLAKQVSPAPAPNPPAMPDSQ